MSKPKLRVERQLDVPLREVSGICAYTAPGGDTALVAMGDASSVLVWAPVVDGQLEGWNEVDLADLADGALRRTGTQAEAVAADGAGQLLVLLEEPSRVLVFDVPRRELTVRVELVVPPDQPVSDAWAADPNSRGEGMVLLAGGRLLVAKEKDPPALLELGPAGAAPAGFGPDRLIGPSGRWEAPPGPVAHFEALATWLLDDDLAGAMGDVSDLAVDAEGRVYLLSDQSSRVARLAPPSSAQGGQVSAEQVFDIERGPDKAEGLAVVPGNRVLVALDTKKPKGNLLVLRLPD